ncbi:hypothetical protein BD324DRAFT_471811 [Kockovaella imperatae]|uniref:Uncharacterized protein n=1 Tax=Kockovaella imperatae TaxID=4999 RepID=A0A1Y1UFK1_9TREE|nr:hypothetical protein BD324DRAFT_471811 [Kockovaella imperatae]ORX36831.1 hypothetical protein BD324DRAFT_471811 [Kockovaella imperatae]
MDRHPLSLSLARLAPHSLFIDDPEDPPPPRPISSAPEEPDGDIPALSITHNYTGPYPAASLGANLEVGLELRNVSQAGVKGVRMMCEVQGPGGRYRLGEVVHGQQEEIASATVPETNAEDKANISDSTTKAGSQDGETQGPLESDPGPGSAASAPPPALIDPELPAGDHVKLDVETEIKELGMHILICSVAWETPDGRRTFQRFLKFNVTPPLAIKTRIYNSPHPNTTLDPVAREYIYLEILMQNISFQGLMFDRVVLETVYGLSTLPLSSEEEKTKHGEIGGVLLPGNTRQQLFKLAPTSPKAIQGPAADSAASSSSTKASNLPHSSFLPTHPPGSILPLGRLDLTWRAGETHDKGRLQTSTLNRRIPNAPPPLHPALPGANATATRAMAPATAATPSPAHASIARMASPKPPVLPLQDDDQALEYDLTVLGDRDVLVEEEFELQIRVGVRSPPIDDELDQPTPPAPVRIALQYLVKSPPAPPPPLPPPLSPQSPPSQTRSLIPTPLLDSISRASTPLSNRSPALGSASAMARSSTTMSAGRGAQGTISARPFSPLSSPPMTSSAPMTPVQTQLRQATNQALYSPKLEARPVSPLPPALSRFPPLPFVSATAPGPSFRPSSTTGAGPPPPAPQNTLLNTGRIHYLGSSLQIEKNLKDWTLVEERMGTTYTDPTAPSRRWETVHMFKLRFIALDEGLAELGGVRVLVVEDEKGLSGSIAREWNSIGDVWVTD